MATFHGESLVEVCQQFPTLTTHNCTQKVMLEAVRADASDIIFQTGQPVLGFVRGSLLKMTRNSLRPTDLDRIAQQLSNIDSIRAKIASGQSFDKSVTVPDDKETDEHGDPVLHRFRVNISPCAFENTAGVQIVCRAIPSEAPSVEAIGLEPEIVAECSPSMGGVILAGETGSGKTTTFAAMTRYVMEGHTPIQGPILTFEEPIEYTYSNISSNVCTIAQHEVGIHTPNFAEGVRGALRRTPRLCLVGELRDFETIDAAIELMNTGCPLYTTTHANDVSLVFRRLTMKYVPDLQAAAYQSVVASTHMIVSQVLVPNMDNTRRICLREWVILNDDLKLELSLVPVEQAQSLIRQAMRDGAGHSMRDTVIEKFEGGVISETVAYWALRRYGYRDVVLNETA